MDKVIYLKTLICCIIFYTNANIILNISNEQLDKIPSNSPDVSTIFIDNCTLDSLENISSYNKLENLTIKNSKIHLFNETIYEVRWLSQLIELNLEGSFIHTIDLRKFKTLRKLKILNLSKNPGLIYPGSCRLYYLTTLDLRYNGLQTFPYEFQESRNLEELYLDGNNITEIPGNIQQIFVKLKKLGLKGNPLKTLPDHLRNISNIGNNEMLAKNKYQESLLILEDIKTTHIDRINKNEQHERKPFINSANSKGNGNKFNDTVITIKKNFDQNSLNQLVAEDKPRNGLTTNEHSYFTTSSLNLVTETTKFKGIITKSSDFFTAGGNENKNIDTTITTTKNFVQNSSTVTTEKHIDFTTDPNLLVTETPKFNEKITERSDSTTTFGVIELGDINEISIEEDENTFDQNLTPDTPPVLGIVNSEKTNNFFDEELLVIIIIVLIIFTLLFFILFLLVLIAYFKKKSDWEL